jgi:hypothetical protein
MSSDQLISPAVGQRCSSSDVNGITKGGCKRRVREERGIVAARAIRALHGLRKEGKLWYRSYYNGDHLTACRSKAVLCTWRKIQISGFAKSVLVFHRRCLIAPKIKEAARWTFNGGFLSSNYRRTPNRPVENESGRIGPVVVGSARSGTLIIAVDLC